MRLDHLLFKKKEYECNVYAQSQSSFNGFLRSKKCEPFASKLKLAKQDEVLRLLTCSSFFPYSVKVTDMFFEILKEGTESILIK